MESLQRKLGGRPVPLLLALGLAAGTSALTPSRASDGVWRAERPAPHWETRTTADRESAELVLIGHVFTGEPAAPWTEVVAVRDGRIAYFGDTSNLSRLVGRHTRVVRARAGTILPGFVDAHAHLGTGLLGPSVLDLREAHSREDVLTALTTFGAEHPAIDPIVGFGFRLAELDATRREDLDDALPDRPVFLLGAEPFALWANSRALETLPIPARDTGGLWIERDPSGTPTGLLIGPGLRDLLPPDLGPTAPERRAELTREVRVLPSFGVTEVHGPLTPDAVSLLEQMDERGELPVRVVAESGIAQSARGSGGRVRVRATREPPHVTGALPLLCDDPRGAAVVIARAGLQPFPLSGVAEAGASPHLPEHPARSMLLDPRDTIPDHAPMRLARPALLHAACWADAAFREQRLGLPAGLRLLPLGDLVEDGLRFGSDYPLAPLDPLLGLDAALHRADPPLTLEQALAAATTGPLRLGAPADLVVLDRNLSAFADADLSRISVRMTVLDGEVVFER